MQSAAHGLAVVTIERSWVSLSFVLDAFGCVLLLGGLTKWILLSGCIRGCLRALEDDGGHLLALECKTLIGAWLHTKAF